MDTDIPPQLQKVETEKAIRAFDNQRNSLGKDGANKDSRHTAV